MKDSEKAEIILASYKEFYPKSLDPSLTPHVSMAPNHPSVDPYHVDDQILREMNAKDYCDWVRWTVCKMRVFEGGLYSAILNNKYLLANHLTDVVQSERMHVNVRTFYRKVHHAEIMFSRIIPVKMFGHLYKMAINMSRG